MDDIKKLFLRGLTALLPTVVTIALAVWAFNWINDRVASPITSMIIGWMPDPDEVEVWGRRFAVSPEDALDYGRRVDQLDPRTGRQLTLEFATIYHPACDSPDEAVRRGARLRRAEAMWHIFFRKYKLNVIGFLLAIVMVCALGYVLSGLLGKTAWRVAESAILRVPVVRSLYPNVKQVTDFLFGNRQLDFKGVVAVEYPRPGVWSLGLITGQAMVTVRNRAPGELVTIFVPSSPTPVTGYTIMVPRADTIELALTIDEALRFTISGGVIMPPSEGGRPEMVMPDAFGSIKKLNARKERNAGEGAAGSGGA